MPIYEFIDVQTDERFELEMSSADAPRIGDEMQLDGRTVQRLIPSGMTFCAVATLYCPGAPSLPRARWNGYKWLPPEEEPWHPPTQKYDQKGKPVFENLKAKDDFIARSNGTYAYGVD